MAGFQRVGLTAPILLLVAALGCDDGRDGKVAVDDAAAGQGGYDAGPSGSDAGVARYPAADGSAAEPDGASTAADAGAHSDGSPAVPGFRVELRHGTRGASGVTVLFHDERGAVIGEHVSDSGGAVLAARAPSMITAWTAPITERPFPYRSVLTYTGLEDGDQLVIALPEPMPPELVAHYDLSWDAPQALTMRAQVGGCGNGWAPLGPEETWHKARVGLTRECVDGANAVLAAYVWDNDMGVHVDGFYFDKAPPPV